MKPLQYTILVTPTMQLRLVCCLEFAFFEMRWQNGATFMTMKISGRHTGIMLLGPVDIWRIMWMCHETIKPPRPGAPIPLAKCAAMLACWYGR